VVETVEETEVEMVVESAVAEMEVVEWGVEVMVE